MFQYIIVYYFPTPHKQEFETVAIMLLSVKMRVALMQLFLAGDRDALSSFHVPGW